MSSQLTLDYLQELPVCTNLCEISNSYRSLAAIKKEFQDTIRNLTYSRHAWQVWQDFCELGAITLANHAHYSQNREDKYMKIIGNYDEKEVQQFPKLLGMTAEALQGQYCDFLGQMFMELELGNKWRGQFFTPYPVCQLMAQMTFDIGLFEHKPVVTANDPCVGGGAMVIALCEYLDKCGIDYPSRLVVVAQDVDLTAVHMCYIQLSLIRCSAKVIHGNTLAVECRDTFITPMGVRWGWLN